MILGDAQIEEGLRVYAIGDVHGCIEPLLQLLNLIEADLAERPVARWKMIFLGDYIDRGPANSQVLDHLIHLQHSDTDCVFLMGNHDERISVFLREPDMVWDDVLRWGGARTLEDYGIVIGAGESHYSLSKRFASAMPDSHKDFLRTLKRSYQVGDYFFCHAGVRPGTPIAKQTDHDLIWIRNDFLIHENPFEKVIVHGHTPVSIPEVKPNRINVDTCCYNSGILTAVILEQSDHRFIQTG
ncbi:MAG: metallophosphoesterase [Pseudomonadota bacterium]